MNIFLWVLQVFLALHTAMGAFWKFSHNAEQTMPSLKAIPDSIWMLMAVVEIVCALALILPAVKKSWGKFIPMAALFIVAEMLVFCILHLASGDTNPGPMIYWLVVAVLCAFIAYGRKFKKPIK